MNQEKTIPIIIVTILVIVILLFIGQFVYYNFIIDRPSYVEGEIVVDFYEHESDSNITSIVENYNCSVKEIRTSRISIDSVSYDTKFVIVQVPDGEEENFVKIFENEPSVLQASVNGIDY